ncbi:hypothetical protein EJ04DRAFT_166585 [Polyplosphaeria fusca]|uniref:Uncharacterized protein n=1 Tax=Polyplosphaeria fusca TaxID=682080 RepID=A0A9P4R8A4_9PLEO|nr:hypothetical protein EJ04DRAFT_166585 [Polyplosphaeria fusca]
MAGLHPRHTADARTRERLSNVMNGVLISCQCRARRRDGRSRVGSRVEECERGRVNGQEGTRLPNSAPLYRYWALADGEERRGPSRLLESATRRRTRTCLRLAVWLQWRSACRLVGRAYRAPLRALVSPGLLWPAASRLSAPFSCASARRPVHRRPPPVHQLTWERGESPFGPALETADARDHLSLARRPSRHALRGHDARPSHALHPESAPISLIISIRCILLHDTAPAANSHLPQRDDAILARVLALHPDQEPFHVQHEGRRHIRNEPRASMATTVPPQAPLGLL